MDVPAAACLIIIRLSPDVFTWTRFQHIHDGTTRIGAQLRSTSSFLAFKSQVAQSLWDCQRCSLTFRGRSSESRSLPVNSLYGLRIRSRGCLCDMHRGKSKSLMYLQGLWAQVVMERRLVTEVRKRQTYHHRAVNNTNASTHIRES